MATKGFADNPVQAMLPSDTDWLGIQQGATLADMKKITYADLMGPFQEQIDGLDTTKAKIPMRLPGILHISMDKEILWTPAKAEVLHILNPCKSGSNLLNLQLFPIPQMR